MIALIKHGRTEEPGTEHRFHGGKGKNAGLLKASFEELRTIKPPVVSRVLISPMMCCWETAVTLYPALLPQVVEEFRPIDMGIVEGLSLSELPTMGEKTWRRFMFDSMQSFPGGETKKEFRRRVIKAFWRTCYPLQNDHDVALILGGAAICTILDRFDIAQHGYYAYSPGFGQGVAAEWTDTGLLRVTGRIGQELGPVYLFIDGEEKPYWLAEEEARNFKTVRVTSLDDPRGSEGHEFR